MLWPAAARAELLRGSPAAAAAEERAAALAAEWTALQPALAAQRERYPEAVYNAAGFGASLAVVLRCAVLLPAADCFALLPLASAARRRATGPGESAGAQFGPAPPGAPAAVLDYDAGRGAVVLLATRPLQLRAAVVADDAQARPSAELLLAGGASAEELGEPHPGDCLTWAIGLLPGDRLAAAKRAVLEAAGLADADQRFPVYAAGMPTALLAYMRLSRITDVAELARVRFDADSSVSALNEYEVLQLMLAEARERLAGYAGDAAGEAELALLRTPGSQPEERAAAQLRLNEKALLNETVAALRARLAPIRASPGKGGRMRADHSDIAEIFEQLENIQSAPRNIINGFLGWGEDDKKDGCG
jgi:histone-lysine N-methyltransferase SETD3